MTDERRQGYDAYINQLFMLQNLSSERFFAETADNKEAFDTRNLAPRLSGKSVLLIVGSEDTAVSPEIQSRLVEVYKKNPEINLTAEVIPGDHSFSGTRIRLQRLVIDWVDNNCR